MMVRRTEGKARALPIVAFLLVVASVFATAALSGRSGDQDARPAHRKVRAARPQTRVGAWSAALAGGGTAVVDRTIRMVVHPTIGGAAIRVRLSNRYGAKPVKIGAVDVALQKSGGDAVPGTHHAATFGGTAVRGTTLPAGADIATDPLPMSVTADQNLLVSVYFPGNTGPTPRHWLASEITYCSTPGNHSADDTAAAYPVTDGVWYYLDGLDVAAAGARGTLVALGDSITDGARSTVSGNTRWPDLLAARLRERPGGSPYGVVNAGLSGNRLLTDNGTRYGVSGLHRFGHDVLGQPGVSAVIVLEGINDISVNRGPRGPRGPLAARDLINGYRTLIGRAHAAGVRIYGATLLPYGGSLPYTAAGEAIRTYVNHWMRTSGAFDGVFDLDAATRDPADPHRLAPAYDSGDHLHPKDAGYRAMAAAIDLDTLTSGSSAPGRLPPPGTPRAG
ncbi:Lysophospholipase L1 [Actinacidiphila alni]|uniref:Lysophospholipase L1 n=1 Tax=Actinacidiphila alni TaxID=380248 RepID=A0A1I2DNS0_9ACTN|nr:SGNH/GDSL hydrolase family protein [Actinacidiphila alni]SFE82146.1 Lysophospholipase L1 [Actinacidiphila alni]